MHSTRIILHQINNNMRSLSIAAIFVMFVSCNNGETKSATGTQKDTVSSVTTITETNNTLSDAEKTAGWKLLFDGSSTAGWHVFNNKSDGHAWVVNNGAIHLDPKEIKEWQTVGGGDLITAGEYDNFHFTMEWKVADSGNSGLILFINENTKYEHTWHTGPEMQVLDNNGHPDSKIIKHRAADLYDLISSFPETVKKAGEWNKVDVISNKDSLEFHLNGTKVLGTRMWDDTWKKMIKGSKFKDMPDFGTYKKGHIGLQDHGNKVWFRNIKIMKL